MNKLELEKKMVDEAIDHEARRLAQAAAGKAERAIDQIQHNQETIRDALRRQETFEVEVRSNMQSLHDKVVEGHTRIEEQIANAIARVHQRLDTLIRGSLIGALGMVVGLIVYIWTTQVAG